MEVEMFMCVLQSFDLLTTSIDPDLPSRLHSDLASRYEIEGLSEREVLEAVKCV
jgi:hypothetical protein